MESSANLDSSDTSKVALPTSDISEVIGYKVSGSQSMSSTRQIGHDHQVTRYMVIRSMSLLSTGHRIQSAYRSDSTQSK